jgi:hypothetical protein
VTPLRRALHTWAGGLPRTVNLGSRRWGSRCAGAFGAAFFVTPLAGGALLGDGSSAVPWVIAAGAAVLAAGVMFALSGAIEARRAAAAAVATVA